MNRLLLISGIVVFVAATFLMQNTTQQAAKAISCAAASLAVKPFHPPPISAHCGPTFCSVQSDNSQFGALGQSSSSGKGSCAGAATAQGNGNAGLTTGATDRGSTCGASAVSGSGVSSDFHFGSGTSGCSASTHSP